MPGNSVAAVYAEAFADVAEKHGVLREAGEDLFLIKQCYASATAVWTRLQMPSLTGNERVRIIGASLGKKVQGLTMQLMTVMIMRGRVHFIPGVYDAFMNLCDKRAGILDVTVTSALNLDAEERAGLASVAKRKFGNGSRIAYAVDPSLLGGYRIATSDEMIDYSVRHGLDELRKQLLHA